MNDPRKVMEGLARRLRDDAMGTGRDAGEKGHDKIVDEGLVRVLEQSGFLELLEAGDAMVYDLWGDVTPTYGPCKEWTDALAQIKRFAAGEET